MRATIIDGRAAAQDLSVRLVAEIAGLRASGGRLGIATLTVGDDYGASMYRSAIERLCDQMGLAYQNCALASTVGNRDVIEAIQTLNADSEVSGILPLRPLPVQIDEATLVDSLAPEKDIDCLHPINMGRLALGKSPLAPATPAACLELLERYLRDDEQEPATALEGAEVCIVGHSNTVGKPLALMLLNRNATISVTHVYTSNKGDLGRHTRNADILVVAAGVPELIRAEHVKEGAVVLDVGINRVLICSGCGSRIPGKAGRCMTCGMDAVEAQTATVGDVEFGSVVEKAGAISPVPGGVGAVTNMMLVRNTVQAARLQLGPT